MISVGDVLGAGYDPVQRAIDGATNYNNVSVVNIPGIHAGGGVNVFDLGVDPLYCQFSVCGVNPWAPTSLGDFVAGAGTTQAVLIFPGHNFYKENTTVAMHGKINVGGDMNKCNCYDRLEPDATIPGSPGLNIGMIVHNVNRNSWSYITAFDDNFTLSVTVIEAGTGAPVHDDVVEFYSNGWGTYIDRITESRGCTCSVTPGQYDRLIVDGPGYTGVPVPGDTVNIGPSLSVNPNDRMHQPALVISPPRSYHGSGPDHRLQIMSSSEFRLDYIVRYKT